MSQLTLYGADGSCALVPHMLLQELEIPFSRIRMHFAPSGLLEAADGSLPHAEYLKVHPSGYVPALSIDGFIITEMPAILQCIASLVPERALLGSKPMEKFRVEEWMVWLSGTLHGSGFGGMWRPARFVDEAEDVHASIMTKGRKKVLACYDRIESRVQEGFAVGDSLTVVDFYLHTF